MKLYEKIYDVLVRKNPNVQKEYERYVREHLIDHYENRWRHWKILWKLNLHYRLRKKNIPLLYWDEYISENSIQKRESSDNSETNTQNVYEHSRKIENESTCSQRPLAHHIAKYFMEYDVISFDVFDTLILRPFAAPTDLFFLLEAQMGQRNLHQIRIECEKVVRNRALLEKGNREITIYDIWNEIEKVTGISAERGVKEEFELEKKLCFANPYFKRIWDILKSYDKVIYVISDMYYPKHMIEEILFENGYQDIADIIVSCDYNCSKNTDGILFKYLLRKAKGKGLLHVGDNFEADIVNGKRMGIDTYYYKGVNEVGKEFRTDKMSKLIGAGYSGIVNTRLHCGLKTYNDYYEYGYIYGGIYVLGFVQNIINYCKIYDADKILFLARDGAIYSKVYAMISNEVEWEYVYWSRMANIVATIKTDRFSFTDRFLRGKVINNIEVTISDLFKSAGLETLLVYLKEYDLREEEYLNKCNELIIQRLIQEHYEEIIGIYNKIEENLSSYFKKILGKAKKVLIVDVGWTGSNVEGLTKKLTKDWKLCEEAKCILAGSNTWNANITTNFDSEALIYPYLFGETYNREIFSEFVNENYHLGPVLFEIFTQASAPSFKGVGGDKTFIFDIPEVENYYVVSEIHKGIIDFVKDYTEKFSEYGVMMNISGYDAYMPFRQIFQNLEYYKAFFSTFVFSTSIFSNTEKQNIETLYDIITQRCNEEE